jgi:hypothetical protein
LQRLQRETTSNEFVEWMQFLEQDWDIPTRQDYFLAQIAAEMRRSIAREPKAVKLEHFMLKFATPAKRAAREAEQQHGNNSKAHWLAFFGLGKKGAT